MAILFPLKSLSASQIHHICIKKAAHGLKAPCDSSLSSVSLFAGAQLNPQPVHIMGQLDWSGLTCSPPFVKGSDPAMVEQFTSVKEKEMCGDKAKVPETERSLPFFFSCCLFTVLQRPYFERLGG